MHSHVEPTVEFVRLSVRGNFTCSNMKLQHENVQWTIWLTRKKRGCTPNPRLIAIETGGSPN